MATTVSRKLWVDYVNKLSAIDKTAGLKMKQLLNMGGLPQTPEAAKQVVDYANGLVMKYGEASAALAAEMYDAISTLEKANVPPAVPAEIPSYGEVAKAVNGTLKTENPEIVVGAVERLVKMPSADTMIQNAKRDGAEWAWIPNGDTCVFCLTLASRGWQPASKAVLDGGHAEHIHAHCDCTFMIRHDSNMNVQGYDPDKLREVYYSHNGDLNEWRREIREQNKDRINAQKRAMYAERKALQDGNNGDTIKKNNGDIQLRIPQIPASTISKKIEKGEYSLKLSQQNYDKHIEGTFDYERYRKSREEKGLGSQSILTITKEEAQNIINTQSGTGIIKVRKDGTPTDLEWITCDKVIGKYYNKGQFHDTNKAIIYHGKKGSHLVPQKGSHYD